MSSESSGGFVAGFLFGALVGAALALVFAPAPGDEVREQIKEKSIELKDRATSLGTEATKKADELVSRGQSILQDQRLRFREAVEEGRQAAARRKEELLSQFEPRPGDAALDITEPQA